MTLLSIPSVFRYRLETIVDVKNNKTCMEVVVTELGRNQHFMIPYTWVQNLLRGIIPVFILIFINAKIINVLRRERVKGKKLSSRNRITLMLIAMVLIFILCLTPDAIMSTFFGKGYVEEDYMFKGIREITDSLVTLNSAVNFILYCSLSAIFRNTFMRVFFGRRYVKMRGGSCRQISRDGTTSIKTKSVRCSTRQNRNGSDKRDRRKSSCRELDVEAGGGADEEHSPRVKVSSNGFSKAKKTTTWANNKNDRSFVESADEKEKKINEMRLTSGVYMGPMTGDVGPTSGVHTGPTSLDPRMSSGVYMGPTGPEPVKIAAAKEHDKTLIPGDQNGPNLTERKMDSGVYMGPTLEDVRLSSGVYMGPIETQPIPSRASHRLSEKSVKAQSLNSDSKVIYCGQNNEDSESVQL
ncbi:unnamed protein product [Lymnaea stagnalis]|uniref:G-protein coupled receptors family 1 profile domain-containing protein n=1 Tax=Lymnaea stagnalis TaxID=6523 RepID=A0AAV2I9Y8_LYMST